MMIGSLFSGIGGLELGLEWAGVGHTVWQVEQDPYCRAVLAKHWPNATRYTDVREVGAQNLAPVDVICGGFPCQDISDAGKRAGITGERSGLWSEFARIVRELRPRYVVVENVRALLVRGIDRVLGDLATAGYDAEWDVLSAADVGAPHLRKRLFIIAHNPNPDRWRREFVGLEESAGIEGARRRQSHGLREIGQLNDAAAFPDANGGGFAADRPTQGWDAHPNVGGADVADAEVVTIGSGLRAHESGGLGGGRSGDGCCAISDADIEPPGRAPIARSECGGWLAEPDVGRVAHGVRARVDRLRALGNAVVPACAEVVGRRLLEIHAERNTNAPDLAQREESESAPLANGAAPRTEAHSA